MKKILDLLKDGQTRSLEMIASELETSVDDIKRKIEFMEQNGLIRRVENSMKKHCGSCKSCSSCGNNCSNKRNSSDCIHWEIL